jgi:hypothetical protein
MNWSRFLRGHATWGFSWHEKKPPRRWSNRYGMPTAD